MDPIDAIVTIHNIQKPTKKEVLDQWIWHSVTIICSTITCCCCCGCCGNYSHQVFYG